MSVAEHDGPPTAIEALRADHDRLSEEEQNARLDAKVAQDKASAISARRKRIEKAIRLLTDEASKSLTKKSLTELLQTALSKGPIPEQQLRERLESHLKGKGRSISGLGLLMVKLRDQYITDDGRWQLPSDDDAAPK